MAVDKSTIFLAGTIAATIIGGLVFALVIVSKVNEMSKRVENILKPENIDIVKKKFEPTVMEASDRFGKATGTSIADGLTSEKGSEVLARVGRAIGLGFAEGLKDVIPNAAETLGNEMAKTIMVEFRELLKNGELAGWVDGRTDHLTQGVAAKIDEANLDVLAKSLVDHAIDKAGIKIEEAKLADILSQKLEEILTKEFTDERGNKVSLVGIASDARKTLLETKETVTSVRTLCSDPNAPLTTLPQTLMAIKDAANSANVLLANPNSNAPSVTLPQLITQAQGTLTRVDKTLEPAAAVLDSVKKHGMGIVQGIKPNPDYRTTTAPQPSSDSSSSSTSTPSTLVPPSSSSASPSPSPSSNVPSSEDTGIAAKFKSVFNWFTRS